MKKLLFAAFLLFSGCAYDVSPSWGKLNDQDKAVSLVWNQQYGVPAKVKPPLIGWVENKDLSCNKNQWGHYDGFRLPDGLCVWGVTYEPGGIIEIAHPMPEWDLVGFSYHKTLPHELYHAWLFWKTGDPDPGHTNPGFEARYGHPPGGAVDQATTALANEGL